MLEFDKKYSITQLRASLGPSRIAPPRQSYELFLALPPFAFLPLSRKNPEETDDSKSESRLGATQLGVVQAGARGVAGEQTTRTGDGNEAQEVYEHQRQTDQIELDARRYGLRGVHLLKSLYRHELVSR